MQKAQFYTKENGRVTCLLCPRRCNLEEGQEGICGARRVMEGELYSVNYGLCSAVHWDPVEKKPLYHFYPGKSILSLGTYGCNLLCRFCQNWSIARGKPTAHDGLPTTPAEILAALRREGGPGDVAGVAFTYNEPTIWYEFLYDTARLVKKDGYRTVMVTNGYIGREPLEALLPFIDAFNIDVKAFSDTFYRAYCRGTRGPVLDTVELAAAYSHVEITCLLIPTLNDNPAELASLTDWLAGLSPEIPLHFSRYFPQYQMNLPPTPLETMEKARADAHKKLHYVYLGNVDLPGAADTLCPACANLLISRRGYHTSLPGLEQSRCRRCNREISLVLP
ncbi:MAG: AmmeMemoRadiSam system radical SAM enzyme [Bacillota bacterium]